MAVLWRDLRNAVGSCLGGTSRGWHAPREEDEEPGRVGGAVRRWNKSVEAPPSAGEGTAAAPIAKRKSHPTCAACRGRIYPTDAAIQSFGETLHAACFKCRLCHCKMLRHPLDVHFRLPDDVDDDDNDDNTAQDDGGEEVRSRLAFLCGKCQTESIASHKEKLLCTTAGQRITIDDHEEGDVDGVLDAIGDELEEIMLDNVPRCAACGRDFLTYRGEVKLVGTAKYHADCFEYGGGRRAARGGAGGGAPEEERALTPLQALQHLPERIIVRLAAPATAWSTAAATKPLVTLFFAWSTRAADLKRLRRPSASGAAAATLSAEYALDATAAPPKKHLFLEPAARGSVLPELVGCDHVFPGCVAAPMDADPRGDVCSFCLSCVKHQRRHVLTLQMRKVRSCATTHDGANDGGGGGAVPFALDPASALLKVEIHS